MVNVVRRTAVALAAAGLVLAACGTTEDTAPITSDEPAPTSTESDISEVTVGAPAETEPSAATVASDADTDPAEAAPAVSDPPPPVVPEAMLGGRAFATELSPTSDFPENALPDIQVDDIRRQTKVALRNVFPAERPVLLWLWAPH
ncbi:MAG: hypothetical protein P8P69_03010 [Ilumatobacter sp.]|jgi:hypothetical protein|uniref:hypothetical protein n=1 Tax=Ilumatobacter sp. TaxID=1967498 RepID=UPI002A2DA600|nr:hypothetical protein [Ilumatobacter sp.]MDG1390995.1 hypothetical protein [Ilumatobacter sp.]MDG1786120.1 hypothetical protein [Ilumatobacter sp.]